MKRIIKVAEFDFLQKSQFSLKEKKKDSSA